MTQKNRNRFLLFAVFVLLLAMSACGSSDAESSKPASGMWEATADFGAFAFEVNPEGTRVTYLVTVIPECGNYSKRVSYEGAWDGFSITDGEFTYDDDQSSSFEGNFDKSGLSASGDWTFSDSDCTLSGTWEAAPLLGGEGTIDTSSSEIPEVLPEQPIMEEPVEVQ